MLNKQRGNMFSFCSHTWNPIKGRCQHSCSYCYMKRFPQKEIRLDEKCFKDNLGSGNTIFVGSSTDMFAENIPVEWLTNILACVYDYPDNTYLFQSKNPKRFEQFAFPDNVILATTIETNDNTLIKKYSANNCSINERALYMNKRFTSYKSMVTIEPIMDFNLTSLLLMIKAIEPIQVNIGADSGHNNLPEPSKEKTLELISELKKFTKVHIKDTLKRIIGGKE